jgi:copper homeostasis protein CutC
MCVAALRHCDEWGRAVGDAPDEAGFTMHDRPTLEVPVDSLEAAVLAAPFADRVELCDDLGSEGWSPTVELVTAVRGRIDIARTGIVAMLRPRVPGLPTSLDIAGFTATPAMVEACLREIDLFARAGATSVAIGPLTPDGHVDLDAARRMRDAALGRGLVVAFLRTFDLLSDRARGMRDLTDLGITRVVTAGVPGWDASVRPLAARIACLAEDSRIARDAAGAGRPPVEVVPGGGVRASNASDFLGVSPHLHASCRRAGTISLEELELLAAVIKRHDSAR